MKKVVLAVLVAVLMASCGGGKKTEVESKQAVSDISLDQAFKDEHTAKNSLDYAGTYRGTLPTASGEGMEVILILTDSTYSKSVSYVGKKGAAVVEQGKYAWDENGTVVTLTGSEVPNQYFVGENVLFQLDAEGKRIEGEMAELYQLNKDLEN